MNIELVGVSDIDRIWPQVGDDIARCLRKAPTDIGAGDVWVNCRSGQWLLIVAHDRAKIHGTTVWRFANGYLECLILVGRGMAAWLSPVIETATNIAQVNGCRGLVATGRPSLSKFIKEILPKAKAYRVAHIWEF